MAENQQSPENSQNAAGPEGAAMPAGPIRTVVESPEPWQRVVKAEIDREHFDQEYATRLKKAAKNHHKPGFRKGKTPRAVVEKELGQSLRMETIEGLIPQAWMRAVLEHRLSPINDPALENLNFEEEGPLSFDLVVEVRPDVEAKDFDGIPVRRREVEVTDQDVDEVLERLLESRAEFKAVERAAAEGDQITLDLTPEAWEGSPDGGKTIEDQKFVLGAESNMPAFNETLGGVVAGDAREVEVVYPADHPNENLKGQTIRFRCAVKEVAEKAVPVADDAFAASLQEGQSLAELRTSIRADLEQENERRVASELDQQILRELVARNDVSLPPSMVDKYLASGLEELHRRNSQYGRPNTPEEDEQYREAGRPHAERALAGMLLLEALRRQEDIKVADEDVDERIGEIAAQNGFPVDDYRKFVNSGDGNEKERIEYDLLERRAYDFLLSRAEITTVPADTDVLTAEEE